MNDNKFEEVAETFEDFKRKLIGDSAIAGDMGYMEGLEDHYNELGDNSESFEDFQERMLRQDYADNDFRKSLGRTV